MKEGTTRLIATVVIWAAAAGIFLGGFVRISWTGAAGGIPLALGVSTLFLGAGYATAKVWSPGKPTNGRDSRSDGDDA